MGLAGAIIGTNRSLVLNPIADYHVMIDETLEG
jgi:hypothetical protein